MAFKMAQLFLVMVASWLSLTEAGPSSNAMAKVIEMLNSMAVQGTKEQKAEQVAYAEYSTWCSTETASLSKEIQQNTASIESLAASVQKMKSDSAVLATEIGNLKSQISSEDQQKSEAAKQRETDSNDFKEQEADFSESVSALERAIAVMQKQSYDRPASLLQMPDDQIPAKVKSMVAAFLATSSEDDADALGAPQANAYEFQSGGIVDLLKKLLEDFRKQLQDAQVAENNNKHNYEMVNQHLTASIAEATQDVEQRTVTMSKKDQKAAEDQKQLTATSNLRSSNQQTLKETQISCQEKALSYEEKQKLRTEELQAIRKAVEILSAPDAQGAAEAHFAFAQASGRGTSLALRKQQRSLSGAEGIRHRVREFLEGEGNRLHSEQLGLLAEKISADPFVKVKKLIENMINRLAEEANADANKEGFCDKEFGKSEITRTKLSEELDALTASIDNGKASIAELSATVKSLNSEITEIDSSVKEATELRTTEKAQNAVTVEEAKAAQVAVAKAIKVLKDFYSTAGTATGFIQLQQVHQAPQDGVDGQQVNMGSEEWDSLATSKQGTVDKGHKAGMQTFGATYSGQQEEAGGVVAMLDVILSDFATLQADTETAEAESQHTYEALMTENKKNRAVKSKQVQMNTADLAAARSQLATDEENLRMTQDQKLAADRYHKSIEDQCVDKGMTFEERTKAREAEIASLKEALRILGDEQ